MGKHFIPTQGTLEGSVPVFQGGKRGAALSEPEFRELASAFFDNLLYEYATKRSEGKEVDQQYRGNEEFWSATLDNEHFQGQRVALRDFHITEWLPASPGRYFTEQAKSQRAIAIKAIDSGAYFGDAITRDVYNATDGILLPAGKDRMMLGGLGSIRLRSKVIDGERLYYLGASSTGKSHEGVPIALREENYRDIVQLIKSSCGARANIIGTLQALPMERSTLHLNSAIPRYSILVEKAEVLGPSSPRDLLITVAVMHAPHIRGQLLKSETWAAVPRKLCKSWTFCSFTPDRKERALRKAVDWLRAYAIRFSGDPNPMIFSDFDEHYQHFADPVEFSLQGLFAGDIDITTLKHYAEMYGLVLNIETLHVGDVVRDIQNSTIINRSEVKLTEETFLGRLKRRLMGNRREHS